MAWHLNILNIPQHGTAAIQVSQPVSRSRWEEKTCRKRELKSAAWSFSQRHYSEEDPEKEQRVKEIELLLMSTEDELRGQPSLPVSSFGGLEGQWLVSALM